MKKITRDEVSQTLVSDKYFEKGQFFTKITQSLLTFFAWIGVIIPFIWLSIPTFFEMVAQRYHFITYSEEVHTLRLLILFLGGYFLLTLFFFACLTANNNHQFSSTYQEKILHDRGKEEQRKSILEDFYNERFGSAEQRTTTKFYVVHEEENIDTDTVKGLYKEKGVTI